MGPASDPRRAVGLGCPPVLLAGSLLSQQPPELLPTLSLRPASSVPKPWKLEPLTERGDQVEQCQGKNNERGRSGDIKFQGLGKHPVADRLQSRQLEDSQ